MSGNTVSEATRVASATAFAGAVGEAGASTIRWASGPRLFAIFFAVASFVLGHATTAQAAPGGLDTTFDGDGKVAADFVDAFSDSGLDVAVQEDGKILVAGDVQGFGTGHDFGVARYNPDGSPDATFGAGGQVITPVGAGASTDSAYGVAVRPDGKIVAAGFANAGVDFAAVRYNPDGSLDQSFGGDGKVITDLGSNSDYAVDVAVRGEYTILAGRTQTGSNLDFAMVRYDNGGTPDPGFGTGGVVETDLFGSDDFGEDIAVEPGGKIVFAGSARDPNNAAAGDDFALARYNADGTLDSAFGSGGKARVHFGSGNDNAYAVGVQEDGKIVVGGKASTGSGEDFALARFRTNGSLDGEFDFDGKLTTDFGGAGDWLWDLAVQDDGKTIVAGTSGNSSGGANFAVVRYNPDGSLDTSFDHDGRTQTDFFGFSDEARSVALQDDGKIVAAGMTYNPNAGGNFALARYFGGNDASPPRLAPPTQDLPVNSALGAVDVPVKLSWSATDLHGNVTGYQLQRGTDGDAYAPVPLPSGAATTTTLPLAPGHAYRFRVRATDDNGNTSFWKYGPRFSLDALQESVGGVSYPSGTWKTQATPGAYGGRTAYATVRGATSRLSFTGSGVAWVAPKSMTRGQAAVYLDGAKVATVDLYSPKALVRRVVFAAKDLDPTAQHTLEVRTLGTAGRPRVDVDAFVVLR